MEFKSSEPGARWDSEAGARTAGLWFCLCVLSASLRDLPSAWAVPTWLPCPCWFYIPPVEGRISSLTVPVHFKMASLRTDSGHLSIQSPLVARGTEDSCLIFNSGAQKGGHCHQNHVC